MGIYRYREEERKILYNLIYCQLNLFPTFLEYVHAFDS